MIQIRSRLVSLRFRHWSRKPFAAFHSTGKHVTIGNLKTIIADRLLGKQKSTAPEAESDEKNRDPGIIALASEDPPEDNVEMIIPEFRRNRNTTTSCEPARVRRGLYYSAWLKALVMIASGHFYFEQIGKKTNDKIYEERIFNSFGTDNIVFCAEGRCTNRRYRCRIGSGHGFLLTGRAKKF